MCNLFILYVMYNFAFIHYIYYEYIRVCVCCVCLHGESQLSATRDHVTSLGSRMGNTDPTAPFHRFPKISPNPQLLEVLDFQPPLVLALSPVFGMWLYRRPDVDSQTRQTPLLPPCTLSSSNTRLMSKN